MGVFDYFKKKKEQKLYDERHLNPIKFHHFTKEIYVTGLDEKQLMDLIREELEITDDPMPLESFFIEKVEDSNYYLVKCSDEIDFYSFHNLVGWCYKYVDDKEVISAFGLAINTDDPGQSYYVILDHENKYGDTLIGVMDNGKSFLVYLPESDKDGGNIIIGKNSLCGKKMKEFMKEKKLAN